MLSCDGTRSITVYINKNSHTNETKCQEQMAWWEPSRCDLSSTELPGTLNPSLKPA